MIYSITKLPGKLQPNMSWQCLLQCFMAKYKSNLYCSYMSIKTRSGTPWLKRLCAPHHNNAKMLINKALVSFFLTAYQIVFLKVHTLSFPKIYNSPYALKKYLRFGHHVILDPKSREWVVIAGMWWIWPPCDTSP